MNKREEILLKSLKNHALPFHNETGTVEMDAICEGMTIQAKKLKMPVKHTFRGKDFVVTGEMTFDEAMVSCIDQCMGYDKMSESELKSELDVLKRGRDTQPLSKGLDVLNFQMARAADQYIKRFPENAHNLDMMQLMDVVKTNKDYGGDSTQLAGQLFENTADKYLSGQHKVEPSIYNAFSLDDLKDTMLMVNSAKYKDADVESVNKEVELNMLKKVGADMQNRSAELGQRDVTRIFNSTGRDYSDVDLYIVDVVSSKYPLNDTAKKVNETCNNIRQTRMLNNKNQDNGIAR